MTQPVWTLTDKE